MIELWNYDKLWNVIILVANYWYVIELSNYLEVRKFREMIELWNYDKLWNVIILSS